MLHDVSSFISGVEGCVLGVRVGFWRLFLEFFNECHYLSDEFSAALRLGCAEVSQCSVCLCPSAALPAKLLRSWVVFVGDGTRRQQV